VARLTYIGHATVLLEVDGTRLLTDPLLRARIGLLRARRPDIDRLVHESLDAVLLSHFHADHLDRASLRILDPQTLVIGPPGTAARLQRVGMHNVEELSAGETATVGRVSIRAVHAEHGRMPGVLREVCLGFVVLGSRRVYFAGDTELYPGLAALADDHLDVALLPVWGWGPRLGKGHLDPERAAQALALIRPRIAVPIHWGVLHPLGVQRLDPAYLRTPGPDFARRAAVHAPEVEIRLVEPGESMDLPGPEG
jgi:L-ascorbate metabolism protein UlaG (beta-lactamase superfamily)